MSRYERRSPAQVLADAGLITDTEMAAAGVWGADAHAADSTPTHYGMRLAVRAAGIRASVDAHSTMHVAMLRHRRFERGAAAISAACGEICGQDAAARLLEYLDGGWTPNALSKKRKDAGLRAPDPKTIRRQLSDAIRALATACPELAGIEQCAADRADAAAQFETETLLALGPVHAQSLDPHRRHQRVDCLDGKRPRGGEATRAHPA
jgi:hypothetical protein